MIDDPGFLDRLSKLGPALLGGLDALETARRHLHPQRFDEIRAALGPWHEKLTGALEVFEGTETPEEARPFAEQITKSAHAAEKALAGFLEPVSGPQEILRAMHLHCQAQQFLYPLRKVLPPVSRFFVEPAFRDRLVEIDPEPAEGLQVGLHRAGGVPPQRGGFALYVPESYDGTQDWPLVVALHGGSGDGADFLWTWLAEARGRRFLLLAPTARGDTWSMMGPDVDAPALCSMVDYIQNNWKVDASHILLTGLSDGATYSLLLGLQEGSPFTALAPVSGVLHPANMENGNIGRAKGKRIYLVHGTLDWLFPVMIAHRTRDALEEAGAELVFREIEDLSHTYPREENDKILTWFDPSLALPAVEVEAD
ncbi:MAG: phospholipase [Candidatus Binatia bacterium]|nr:phospholipase [Candidatus Binatia bacterium]